MADYTVAATLELDTDAAVREAKKLVIELRHIKGESDAVRAKNNQAMSTMFSMFSRLGNAMRGASGGIGRVVLGLTAVAGTYIGVRAVVNTIQDLSRFAIAANSSVENLTLALGTILSQTEHISFEQARGSAEGLYRQMQALAIQAPGTTAELAGVFQMSVGPMRQAGIAMERILTMSRDTLSVASALQIDLPQVSRDISIMMTGAAGQDVRLFRTLRALGLITETTEQWNQMARRSPRQAAERIIELMGRLGGPAAETFGRTWSGVTSTFADLVENFTRVFTSPMFRIVRDTLGDVNAYLLRYRVQLESMLTRMGDRLGGILQRVIDRGREAFIYLQDNWRSLLQRGLELGMRVREMLPQLASIAARMAAVAVAFRGMGSILSAIGAVGGMVTSLGALGVGVGGAGGAGGAGGVGISSLLAALSAVAAPLAAVLAAMAAAGTLVYAAFTSFGEYITRMFAPVWRDLAAVGRNVWAALQSGWEYMRPIFAFIGSFLLANVGTGLRVFAAVLRLVTALWRAFNAVIRVATGDVGSWTDRLTRWFLNLATNVQRVADALVWLAERIEGFARWLERYGIVDSGQYTDQRGVGTPKRTPIRRDASGRMVISVPPTIRLPTHRVAARSPTTPGDRPTTNIDMRGSTINVRQEFREADPDRIWMRMVEGLGREAIVRTTSAYVNAFTR